MLFYIPDLEEYKNYRGLYIEPEKLPGPALTSVREIGNSINNLEELLINIVKVIHALKILHAHMMTEMFPQELLILFLEEIQLIQMVIHTALLNVKIQRRNYYSLAADFA